MAGYHFGHKFCAADQKDHAECKVLTDETSVTRGNIVAVIIAVSRDRQCDLFVMGYHVHSKLKEEVLGSTTRRGLRRSQIPVVRVQLRAPE